MRELTHKELLLIAHSLGVDLFKAVISDKKKDKELPYEFYRNRFNAGKTHSSIDIINELISIGAMKGLSYSPDSYYVREEGVQQFKRQFNELAIYRKPINRDKEYLSHQINFYCKFYNYRFSENNAESVYKDFKKYFWSKYYMSHTMTDVVNKFKSKLKKLFPKNQVKELNN